MKKSSKITGITAIVAAVVVIGLDVWLEARADSFTWSQYLQNKNLDEPYYAVAFVAILMWIIGFLCGHWFWPKRIKQIVKNEKMEKALRANIKYCEYFDGERHCGEIATWGVFDYGWKEFYCDRHKDEKMSSNELEQLESQVLAKEVLAEED